MSYIENMASNFAVEITKSRKYNYSQEVLDEYLSANPNKKCSIVKIKNNR